MLFLFLKVFHGEGNGNPLQYSCLENPVDRGAWWATVHGVARAGPNSVTKKKKKKSVPSRTSLAVHPLRLHASKAGDMGLLSGCKTKIPHVAHHGQKINYKKSAPSNSSKPKVFSRKWSPSQPGLSRMLQSPSFFLFRLFPTHHTFLPCLSAVNPSGVYLPHLPGRFLFLSS